MNQNANDKMQLKTSMNKIDETDIESDIEELRINLHALLEYPTPVNYIDVCTCIHAVEFLASEILNRSSAELEL